MQRAILISTLLILCCASAFAGETKDKTAKTQKKEKQIKTEKVDTTSVTDSTGRKPKITWFYGGKVAFDTYKYSYSVAGNSYEQRTNTFGISPKAGIFINDKMLVGLALWYNTQVENIPAFATTIKELEEYIKSVQNPRTVSNSLTIAPHFRYCFWTFWNDRIGIWGEARPFFSICWINSTLFTNVVRTYEYGFRIGPVFTIDITPTLIFETSIDLLAIGWTGSCFKQDLEYDYQNVHYVLPVEFSDSNFGFAYGFNFRTLYNAIISVGIMKKF